MAKQSKKKEKKKVFIWTALPLCKPKPTTAAQHNSAVATPRAGKPGSADTPAAALGLLCHYGLEVALLAVL